MYDALLLDHDGVLVRLCDVERLHDAARQAFADVGVDPSSSDVRTLAISVDHDELLALATRYDLDPERLWHYRDRRVAEALRRATREGEKDPYEDVSALRRLDLPRGIVSNNQRRVVEFVLAHHGIAEEFDVIRARDPVLASLEAKKPRPTYLDRAITELDISNPLYVGDKESDVVAGQRAGVDVALLRRDHNRDVTPDDSPTYEIRSLRGAVELLEGERSTVD